MLKMEKFSIQKKVLHDKETEKEIWEIGFQENSECVANYFYNQSFSPDERYFIFASDRNGKVELYRMEVDGDEAVRITENFNQWYCWKVYNQEVICNDGETFFAINIFDLSKRIISKKTDDNAIIYETPVVSGDGNKIACLYQKDNSVWSIVCAELKGSELFDVYKFDSKYHHVSHLQCAPAENFILTFAPLPDRQNNFNLPPSERARAWKLDIEKGVAEPFLIMPVGYRATHEYWGQKNNERLYFHKKTVPNFTPTSIASIDIHGNDLRVHFFSENRKLGHSFVSPDTRFMVSDVQEPGNNELYLIDMQTGKSEILCWPDSSCSSQRNQLGHVHPSFSSKGNYIIYSSDRTGKTKVYIIPLK